MLAKGFSKPTDRVERLRSMIVDAVPCIEAERAVLITESYQATEGLPMIMRRASKLSILAFASGWKTVSLIISFVF